MCNDDLEARRKEVRSELERLKKKIQADITEYNQMYAKMPYFPKAKQLKWEIEWQKRKYNQMKAELGSENNG